MHCRPCLHVSTECIAALNHAEGHTGQTAACGLSALSILHTQPFLQTHCSSPHPRQKHDNEDAGKRLPGNPTKQGFLRHLASP